MTKEISVVKRSMDLLSYLPPVMAEVRESKTLAEVENPRLAKLWEDIEGVLKDQFVLDASNHGIKRWEGMLGISPKGTESLETRRFRVLGKLNEVLPYTYRRLLAWLTEVCQGEEFWLTLTPELYQLTLRLAFWDSRMIEVYQESRKMIPANLVLRLLTAFDTNENANVYAGVHSQIAMYAHIDPYQAGSHEGEGFAAVGVVSKVGVWIAKGGEENG